MTSDPRYPVGPFQTRNELSPDERRAMIDEIAAAPVRMREAVRGLSDEQLDTPYREGGWTVRQVVHHVPDSHLNAYCRLKLALTEDEPTIRPYDEATWAEHDTCALLAAGKRWTTAPLVDQGLADKFLETQLRPDLLEAAGVPVRRLAGYDHSYYFIATVIDDHLRHHAKQLL
jgi:hypothetical protein